jgi:hypothetical protein
VPAKATTTFAAGILWATRSGAAWMAFWGWDVWATGADESRAAVHLEGWQGATLVPVGGSSRSLLYWNVSTSAAALLK